MTKPLPKKTDAVAMNPEQLKALQAMTPAQKLEAAMQLYWSARRLKTAWLRQIHPDWSGEQVEDEVRRIFRNA